MRRSDKLDLLHHIDSEDSLRRDVLIPLFHNMGQYLRVDETHGAREEGKDLVLISKDILGDYQYTAVIIKARQLSNATTPRTNRDLITNVCLQIVMSITTGYLCPIQNRHINFNKIVVVTNQSVSQGAIKTFIDAANTHAFPDIKIKQDTDLLDWLDQYMPEFYAVNEGRLASYLGGLKRAFAKEANLRRVPKYSGPDRAIGEVFIPQQLVEYRANDEGMRAAQTRANLRQLLFQRSNCLIMAPSGAGKSTLLWAQVDDLLRETSTKARFKVIPFLFRATQLIERPGDLVTRINGVLTEQWQVDEGFQGMLSDPTYDIKLFIDAIDEVGDPVARSELLASVAQFAHAFPSCRVVVTSRPVKDLRIPGFKTWILPPLGRDAVGRFFQKWFSERPGVSRQIMDDLEDYDILDRIPSTPLVLTLLAIVLEQQTQVELPANIAELYQMFMELLLGKWAIDRTLSTMSDYNIKEFAASELAYEMQDRGLDMIGSNEARALITHALDAIGSDADPDSLLAELLDGQSLLFMEDDAELGFRHPSFKEFLAAKRLVARKAGTADLVERYADQSWQSVIYYYCGLDKENGELLRNLSDSVTSWNEAEFWPGFWSFGHLLQAAYMSDLETRVLTLKQQIAALSSTLDEELRKIEAGETPGDIPLAPALIILLVITQSYYTSRYQRTLYRRVYDDYKHMAIHSRKDRLQLLTAVFLMPESDRGDCLLDVYDVILPDTLLSIIVGFEVERLMSQDARSTKRLRSAANDIRRKVMRRRELASMYLRKPHFRKRAQSAVNGHRGG